MATYVEGLRAVIRDLEALEVDLDDLKDAFAAIATRAAEYAAEAAPHRSGRLAGSVRGNRAKGKAVVMAGRASVPYAGVINYGWPRRHIRARKFMQAADERIGPEAIALLEEGIDKAINRRGLR